MSTSFKTFFAIQSLTNRHLWLTRTEKEGRNLFREESSLIQAEVFDLLRALWFRQVGRNDGHDVELQHALSSLWITMPRHRCLIHFFNPDGRLIREGVVVSRFDQRVRQPHDRPFQVNDDRRIDLTESICNGNIDLVLV